MLVCGAFFWAWLMIYLGLAFGLTWAVSVWVCEYEDVCVCVCVRMCVCVCVCM